MPTPAEQARHTAELGRRAEAASRDPVLQAAKHSDTVRVLETVVLEAAKECASLHWERLEAEKRGRDIQRLASRRIAALLDLASLIRTLHVARAGAPSPEQLQLVQELFLKRIADVARETLPPEAADHFLDALLFRLSEVSAEVAG